jgi:uncharacterized membrane protein
VRDVLLVLSVVLACLVEGVEALTIVLAVGTTRDWRSTSKGVAAAVVTLAGLVAALGPALTAVPLDGLRVVVGALLLIFGLQWLRKAILRASGHKALHDEAAIFAREAAAASAAAQLPSAGRLSALVGDGYAFTVAFKGVLLEGLEVVFIVLTVGSNQGSIPLAAVGAAIAVAIVVTAGFAVRRPLARVPENTMKFAVGVMLTSFGTFWSVEGAGATWPGGDTALLVVVLATATVSLALVAWRRQASDGEATAPPRAMATS